MQPYDGITLDNYADFTVANWRHKGTALESLAIMSLGLAGETGEALEHVKKLIRDGSIDMEKFKLELGDVLFYWCRLARHFELSVYDIMRGNIEKLEARRAITAR